MHHYYVQVCVDADEEHSAGLDLPEHPQRPHRGSVRAARSTAAAAAAAAAEAAAPRRS